MGGGGAASWECRVSRCECSERRISRRRAGWRGPREGPLWRRGLWRGRTVGDSGGGHEPGLEYYANAGDVVAGNMAQADAPDHLLDTGMCTAQSLANGAVYPSVQKAADALDQQALRFITGVQKQQGYRASGHAKVYTQGQAWCSSVMAMAVRVAGFEIRKLHIHKGSGKPAVDLRVALSGRHTGGETGAADGDIVMHLIEGTLNHEFDSLGKRGKPGARMQNYREMINGVLEPSPQEDDTRWRHALCCVGGELRETIGDGTVEKMSSKVLWIGEDGVSPKRYGYMAAILKVYVITRGRRRKKNRPKGVPRAAARTAQRAEWVTGDRCEVLWGDEGWFWATVSSVNRGRVRVLFDADSSTGEVPAGGVASRMRRPADHQRCHLLHG